MHVISLLLTMVTVLLGFHTGKPQLTSLPSDSGWTVFLVYGFILKQTRQDFVGIPDILVCSPDYAFFDGSHSQATG